MLFTGGRKKVGVEGRSGANQKRRNSLSPVAMRRKSSPGMARNMPEGEFGRAGRVTKNSIFAEVNFGGKKRERELGVIETWLSTYFLEAATEKKSSAISRGETEHHSRWIFCTDGIKRGIFSGKNWLPD